MMLLAVVFGTQIPDLAELPSPAYVHWKLARRIDATEYSKLLSRSKSILGQFMKLDPGTQAKTVRKWFIASADRHTTFALQGLKRELFDDQYEVTPSMSKVDLAKFDLILLSMGLKPLFHTDFLIRVLYSADLHGGTRFVINPKKGLPTKIAFKIHTGPRSEPRSTSFDRFSSKQANIFIKWFKDSEPIKQLEPMTYGKMVDQIGR